jgi:hydroxypyruvate isomerase
VAKVEIRSSIRLSCADSAFPSLSHEGALTVINDLEIDAVDVFVLPGSTHTSAEAVLADPSEVGAALHERLARRGMHAADVFAIFGESFDELAVNHPDEHVREESLRYFKALVEFASTIGAPGLTILPGTTFAGVPNDQALAVAAAEVERRARIASEYGLRLSVEPHVGSIIPTPARTLRLLDCTSVIGVTLDLSHFVYQGIDQSESDALLERTRHVHLRQAAREVMQARVREGTIDFPRIRDALLATGYAGYFGLEYQWEEHWLDFTRVDCITETAQLRDLMLGTGTGEHV